jgi:hypothetical protein
MMRTMAVWIGAVLMVGGLWSASVISQGLADEPAAPSRASEGTGSAAGNKTGGSDAAPPPEAGQVQEPTVLLTQAVHFTDAKGQDVVIGPGSYWVDAEGTNRIRLLQAQTGEAVVIDAVRFTHQQTVERPVPVIVPDPQQPDVLHLALLSPGGTGLAAIGTYSGVKPRQVMDQVRFMTAVNMQFTAQVQTLVPGITAPIAPTIPYRRRKGTLPMQIMTPQPGVFRRGVEGEPATKSPTEEQDTIPTPK